MADHDSHGYGSESATKAGIDGTDHGVFDFLKNKDEEKPPQDVTMEGVQEEKKEEEKTTHMEQPNCSDSSPSDEEEGEGGEKKKKKKGLKEKIEEKISGEKEGGTDLKETGKCDGITDAEATHSEDKKGFLEKIKEKLPGQHKKAEEGASAELVADGHYHEGEPKEKKGILEKIKEKMPGCHKNEEQN